MAERWWEDFAGYTTRLIEHVEQTASVCQMSLELDPAISVLCADFMSPTTPGTSAITVSIAPTPRTTRRTRVTSLSASTRRSARLRRADRRGGTRAQRGADSDRSLRSRHEADLLDVPRQSLAGGSRSPPLPAAVLAAAQGGRLNRLATVDQRLARTTRWYGRISDPLPSSPGSRPSIRRHRLRSHARVLLRDRRPDLPGRGSGARRDPRYAERLADELSSTHTPPPASRRSTSGARRSSTTGRISTRRRSSCCSRTTSAFTSTRRAGRGQALSIGTTAWIPPFSTGTRPPRANGDSRRGGAWDPAR